MYLPFSIFPFVLFCFLVKGFIFCWRCLLNEFVPHVQTSQTRSGVGVRGCGESRCQSFWLWKHEKLGLHVPLARFHVTNFSRLSRYYLESRIFWNIMKRKQKEDALREVGLRREFRHLIRTGLLGKRTSSRTVDMAPLRASSPERRQNLQKRRRYLT